MSPTAPSQGAPVERTSCKLLTWRHSLHGCSSHERRRCLAQAMVARVIRTDSAR